MEPAKELSKKTKIRIAISAAAVLLIILFLTISLSKVYVPETFNKSREDAAQASQAVELQLNESIENLAIIARYEREGSRESARALVQEEIAKSDDRNEAALKLAQAVQGMSQVALEIDSEVAKQKVVEAASFQVTAITHILTYNSLLENLLRSIDARFKLGPENSEKRIQGLLQSLNDEAKSINELNQNFTSALNEFDSIVRIKVQ